MYKFFKILPLIIFYFLSCNSFAFSSEEKIKIGLLVPLTGDDKEIGQQNLSKKENTSCGKISIYQVNKIIKFDSSFLHTQICLIYLYPSR